jgi:hypothetical protein
MRGKRGGFFVMIGLVIIMVFAGFDVTAIGPGHDNGWIGTDDPNWIANWASTYTHVDGASTWCTGLSIWNISFKDSTLNNPPDQNGYNGYVYEVTMPWIGIKPSNGNMKYYPFCDDADHGGNMTDQLMLNGDAVVDETTVPNGGTDIDVSYDLCTDGDGIKEWTFALEFSLQGNVGMGQFGQIICRVGISAGPVNGIDEIVYAFLCDANVYDNANNNRFFRWDVDNSQWSQIVNENGYTVTSGDVNGNIAYVDNPQAQRSIKLYPILQPFQCSVSFVALRATGTEYSPTPDEYDNDQNLNGADGLFWYIEDWNCNQHWPPRVGNGWTGVEFNNLQA